MSQLIICERCGSVTNETPDIKLNMCPVCHGKMIPIGLTEDEAAKKYETQMAESDMPIVTRNQCIRNDYYYNKIENREAEVVLSKEEYEDLFGKKLHCPLCNSAAVWTLKEKHICGKCRHKWEE